MSVGPRPKKFNIVRKVHGHTKICEYSVLDQKHPPWANLAQKIKSPSLGIQFGIQTNSNIKNSIVMLTFFAFHQKNPFWKNLVQKIKIDSFSWNLVSILIRICKIWWCCSLFPFSTENTIFGANLVQKIKIVSLSWNLVPKLIWTCTIQRWC